MSESNRGARGGRLPRKLKSRKSRKSKQSESNRPKQVLPDDVSPLCLRWPLDHKLPMVPGCAEHVQLTRRNVLKPLHISDPESDFDLSDPYNHSGLIPSYHPLHDPHSKRFLTCKEHYQVIDRQGLVTPDGGVLCSLKEFNNYRLYLHRLKTLQNDRAFSKELEDSKREREEEAEELLKARLKTQGDAGEWDSHARQVRERKEKIAEEFLKKCLQKQAEAEVRTQDCLRKQSEKRAEKDCQRRITWNQRFYRARGKQKLDIWYKMKQREQMQEDEKERELKMEELKQEKRKRKHEETERRWLERCERQFQQLTETESESKNEQSNLEDTFLLSNRLLQHNKQDFSSSGDDMTDNATRVTEVTKDVYHSEKFTLLPPASVEPPESERSNEEGFKERKCRPGSCHKRTVYPTVPSNSCPDNYFSHPKTAEGICDILPNSEKQCADDGKQTDITTSVWNALHELVVDGAQACIQQSVSSHCSGRLAEGEVDEILVSEIAEEVGQRVLDAATSQIVAMVTESSTIPGPEALEALVGHVNDLMIDLTWDLLLPHLQGREKGAVKQLWRETIMRAACELGRQAVINVVVWMKNSKRKTDDSHDPTVWASACVLTAIISKASTSDILQQLLDPNCRIQVDTLMSTGLQLTDEAVKSAELQVWQYLDKNGKCCPTCEDVHQMACCVAQAIIIHADNNVRLYNCGHQCKELAADCTLEWVVGNLQVRLLAGQICAKNCACQHLLTRDNQEYQPTKKMCKCQSEHSDKTAEQLCAIAIEQTCSTLQCECSGMPKEYDSASPSDPITSQSLDAILLEEIMDAVRNYSESFMKFKEIPVSLRGNIAIHMLIQQIVEQGMNQLQVTPYGYSHDALTFSKGSTLMNIVRRRVKTEFNALCGRILRSLIEADADTVQDLIGWVLQLEQLRFFCDELQCLLAKDRDCITGQQAKEFYLDKLALYTILSDERLSTVKLITKTVQEHAHATLSNGLLPAHKFSETVNKYIFSIVVPNMIHEMELRLDSLIAAPAKDKQGSLIIDEALTAANDTLNKQEEKRKGIFDDSSQIDGTRYNSSSSCSQSHLPILHESNSFTVLDFQNFLMSCILQTADKEVRKLIVAQHSSQLTESTKQIMDAMASRIVDKAIITAEEFVLLSGKDWMELWANPFLDKVLQGTIQLTKEWEVQKLDSDGEDKHVTAMTIEGLKLLQRSRGTEHLLHENSSFSHSRHDMALSSNVCLTKPRELSVSTIINASETDEKIREHFIPLLVEVILHGALSSEIFVKSDVEPTALARCEQLIENLVEELIKDIMLHKWAPGKEPLLNSLLGMMIESVMKGAFNSSNFLLDNISSQVAAHSENLIYAIVDSMLRIHSICMTPSYPGNTFEIMHETESVMKNLIETALCTKSFSVSSCQAVMTRAQEVLRTVLEKLARYKCNPGTLSNLNPCVNDKNETMISNIVSENINFLEQSLSRFTENNGNYKSTLSFETLDTSPVSNGRNLSASNDVHCSLSGSNTTGQFDVEQFLVQDTTDMPEMCIKSAESSHETILFTPAVTVTPDKDKTSVTSQSYESYGQELVKLVEDVVSEARNCKELKQNENCLSFNDIGQLAADITNTAHQFGFCQNRLPMQIPREKLNLNSDFTRSQNLIQPNMSKSTVSKQGFGNFESEQHLSHMVNIILHRAFHTVLSKPCNQLMKQQMHWFAEFGPSSTEQIVAALEETLIGNTIATERDMEELHDIHIKTMYEDLIIDLAERIVRESLRCEWTFTYENWTTSTFSKFTSVLKSIIVDTMLRIAAERRLFLSLDVSSANQVIKRTAEEIYDETVDNVESCCCSLIGNALTRKMSTIAADIIKNSTEDILAAVSSECMSPATQDATSAVGNMADCDKNTVDMLQRDREKSLPQLTTATVTNLQKRMSELVKSEVNEALQQEAIDLQIGSATDQIEEVNRILTSVSHKDCKPQCDNNNSIPKTKANVECELFEDEEVIVVKAVLEACKSLTRLNAQSRVAGQILDNETCRTSPHQSQVSLPIIVQDILLTAVDEVQRQEAQVHLVKQKVMHRVRRKLRTLIKHKRLKSAHKLQAARKENKASETNIDKLSIPNLQSTTCMKIENCNSTRSIDSMKAVSETEKHFGTVGQENSKEFFVAADNPPNYSRENTQKGKTTEEKFLHLATCNDSRINFKENMINILLNEVIDALESKITELESTTLSMNDLQNNLFSSAQRTLDAFHQTAKIISQLESAVTTSILKETMETIVAMTSLRNVHRSAVPDGDATAAGYAEAVHRNMMALRNSPEFLVSCLVMEAQQLALCRMLSGETENPVEDQVSHLVKKTLNKAKLINIEPMEDEKNHGAVAVLMKVSSCLEDEITTGRAIIHHNQPLRGYTAVLVVDMLQHLQHKLNDEVETRKCTVQKLDEPAISEGRGKRVGSKRILKTVKSSSMSNLDKMCDEQVLNQSIADEVTQVLCDGMHEMVEVGWKKSASALNLEHGGENVRRNVETLVMQTLDDVSSNIQIQSMPVTRPEYMLETMESFQNEQSFFETMMVPSIFYACRTGIESVQAILKVVRYNVMMQYAFKPQTAPLIAFKDVSDGLVLKDQGLQVGSPSCLISPRHVPVLGAKAIEESQCRCSSSSTVPPGPLKPLIAATHLLHHCPLKNDIRKSSYNANFLPRLISPPIKHFLHKAEQQNNSSFTEIPNLPRLPTAGEGFKLIKMPTDGHQYISNNSDSVLASLPRRIQPLRATIPFFFNKVPKTNEATVDHSADAPTKQDSQNTKGESDDKPDEIEGS